MSTREEREQEPDYSVKPIDGPRFVWKKSTSEMQKEIMVWSGQPLILGEMFGIPGGLPFLYRVVAAPGDFAACASYRILRNNEPVEEKSWGYEVNFYGKERGLFRYCGPDDVVSLHSTSVLNVLAHVIA